MKSEFFLPIIIFIPLLIVQTTVVNLISVDGVVPDLILILLVFYAVRNDQIYGTVLGFIFGFLFDLITGSLIGSSMVAKTISGFTAGYFSNENKRDMYLKSYVFPLIVLLCGVIDSVVYAFFSTTDYSSGLLLLLIQQGILPGVYTAVISILAVVFIPKRSLI